MSQLTKTVRQLTDVPDGNLMRERTDGSILFKFLVLYQLRGKEMSFHIWAEGLEEAEDILNEVIDTAHVAGQVFTEGDIRL
ncbi:hypothetical protein ACQZ6C_10800 [Rhizobium rhizogenes]